jgi:hypothetical protein
MRRVRFCLALSVIAVAGCGAHLHRPQDAASAEGAAGELKAAQLTDGFAPEVLQAGEMLKAELEVARAWAQQGRDRDLLDVLAATASDEHDPDTEILLHPRCRQRFAGDGWTTLCSKLARRLAVVGGFEPDAAVVVAPVKPVRGKPAPPAPPDRATLLAGTLRELALAWHGPHSDEQQIARAGTDVGLRARGVKLSSGAGVQDLAIAAPRCPSRPFVSADPGLAEAGRRHAELCRRREANLKAVQRHAGGQLGEQATRALAVHAALIKYDAELARRIGIYEASRRPCEARVDPTVAVGTTAPGVAYGVPGCDAAQVQRSFAALSDVEMGRELVALDYAALVREGRAMQLAAQLAALTDLIEAREIDRRSERPAGTVAGDSSALALALHQTIDGIDRVKKVTDAFHVAVLTLIRETLRVEHAALVAAANHAERRRRIELAKLSGQLDEYAQLVEAFARLGRLAAAGCTARPLVAVQAQDGCRDDATRVLQALGNAWTLGRFAQREADVLDLAVRHEASIDRSRAAMAMREVYLAAGVAELVKFNNGGIKPETLALLIVNAVGFGVVAGGVY